MPDKKKKGGKKASGGTGGQGNPTRPPQAEDDRVEPFRRTIKSDSESHEQMLNAEILGPGYTSALSRLDGNHQGLEILILLEDLGFSNRLSGTENWYKVEWGKDLVWMDGKGF
ncbi:hypothetical protein TWF481_006684 [Arthrobotrys musiformis]|uniref:Uncharacterized protein n=1 Tax=Arthrobotrys musiformis TaxID=47236 RepID=A0AAV9WAP5_9PEZI